MQDYIIKTSGRALAQALIADLPEEHGLNIITFGTVSRPTGETVTDDDGQEIPVMEPVPGYWLAVRCESGALPESWTPFVVDDPGFLPGGFSPYVEPKPDPERLAQAKAAKLAELSMAFDQAQATGHTLSVCGFEVDANETADRNVRGLITKLEATGAPSTPFCDYTNTMRQATLAQLKTIQLEIIGYGEALYARKWALREAVNSAETVEDVVMVTVSFDGVGT